MWVYFDTEENTAAFNMAMDEAFAEAIIKNPALSVIRTYSWKPKAISIGYFQNAIRDFNIDKIKKSKIDFVRRTTGGRAVFHANEFTYSTVSHIDNTLLGNNLRDTYNVIGLAILKALHMSGFSKLELKKINTSDNISKTVKPCFSSTGRYEIVYKNKKIVGSAQKRTRNIIQQHGSILLGNEHLKIIDFMNISDTEKKIQKKILMENSTSLSNIVKREIFYKELSAVFVKGFEETFKQKIKSPPLPQNIIKRTLELAKTKYSSPEWNFKTITSLQVI